MKTALFIGLLALAYWKYSADIGELKKDIADDIRALKKDDIGELKKEIAEMKEILKYTLINDMKSLRKGISEILKKLGESLSALKTSFIEALEKESVSIQGTVELLDGTVTRKMAEYNEMLVGILTILSGQGQDPNALGQHGMKRACDYLGIISQTLQKLCLKLFKV